MKLSDKRVIAFVENDFEDLEMWYPVLRLREEGATVHVVGDQENKEYVGKYGVPIVSDYSYNDVNFYEYDAVLVPGGWAPDKLRRDKKVIEIIQYMNDQKQIIGQICHAGWVLISAGILSGKRVTSTPGIKDDMTNAGADWTDDAVVVDGHIVSSRRPPDLPDYLRELINVLENKSK
ncbi:type 1 glutamine amidotransferase domain-containing protein [Pseudalkalibacillus decolorationis]|uniref:type 1 glutamine amidotransferase domain-containing protein n=1 Tax=Pseudalkalibacillus decolorationis TaxID=163879 RepID=UPI00214901C4|nr:type 1 glutamine amidotransferase domain-containing protein [Pseudalkalibacillus decolorationis]